MYIITMGGIGLLCMWNITFPCFFTMYRFGQSILFLDSVAIQGPNLAQIYAYILLKFMFFRGFCSDTAAEHRQRRFFHITSLHIVYDKPVMAPPTSAMHKDCWKFPLLTSLSQTDSHAGIVISFSTMIAKEKMGLIKNKRIRSVTASV